MDSISFKLLKTDKVQQKIMEENKRQEITDISDVLAQNEEENSFNFKNLFTLLILNWQWFVLAMFISLCSALIYLRYKTPTYQVSAKMLIKDEDNRRRSNGQMLANMQDLGFISNSTGIENEIEILQSHILAREVVKDLKLYTQYKTKGRVKNVLIYKNQPISVDLDPVHLARLDTTFSVIQTEMSISDGTIKVKGTVLSPDRGEQPFSTELKRLPGILKTSAGLLTFSRNPDVKMPEEGTFYATIKSPILIANRYVGSMDVQPTSKLTSIAQITIKDENALRAYDYIKQLAAVYNRQANADKNEIAVKTESFINERLEKIDVELGSTEGALETYKKMNSLTELRLDATEALHQTTEYSTKLAEATTQIQLLDYLREYIDEPSNKYELIPSNVGLQDNASTSLIASYNKAVLDRKRLLQSVSEHAPQVMTQTSMLDNLMPSIRAALTQARRSADIQRKSIETQYNNYHGKMSNTPEQERVLTQIGRQQEVKSALYVMLLQKREENSISLAATADKGKLIDDPMYEGKVSPKSSIIMLAALIIGFAIPMGLFYLLQLLRYKIEGHEDVAKLTSLPIIADVAVANNTENAAAGIVVHENKNDQIDEIFRSMRTNIQFMMTEEQKVILFTSSTSGEGKTFNASNLAMSFALLGKKVILCGLDIRKPALGRLFGISDRQQGITSLLTREQVTEEMLDSQINESGINKNLHLLLAGPVPPNPTELLARKNLEDIITLLRKKYDYIILDTAPVGLVSDTLQIGKYTDVSCYVCRADYTPKASFTMINALSAEKKLPNPCIIINGIDMSKKKYGYYYGYGKYGKYGRYGRYGRYSSYGSYGNYGNYGSYGNYAESHYGNKNDNSIKK